MEQRYEFRKRLCEVHRPAITDPAVYTAYEGLDITEEFAILLPKDVEAVTLHAAEDLADYFLVSHGIRIPVLAAGERESARAITLALSKERPDLAPKGSEERAYRIEVGSGVLVTANSGAGLFAATVYLEELMNERRGPRLPFGVIDRRPLFSPRMIHSGYELDEFPEVYLNRVAHDGYDTLLVFVKGAHLSAHGPADFNALIETAERYGLGVYAYSYIVSEKHPDDEGAEEYYESTYGELFRAHPGFRGVIFVGESCEFPSRDPRVYPYLFRYHPKGAPQEKCFSRNFPASDYPDWLALVKRVIYRYRPDADIVFWSYNWGGRPAEERVALIDNLPTDISLQATFEMYEDIPAPEGVREYTSDYSITIPGPGKYFLSEAEAAARRGIPLYTISNTGCRTWDVGVAPYIPAPAIWGERFDKLRECHERYGLKGLMESHHYGYTPSFLSELAKEMGWEPRRDFREHLEAIAIREFGKENLTKVLAAWEHASEAARHNMPTVQDQYGPLRVGPSYPLVAKTRWIHPSDPGTHFGGGRITYTSYGQHHGFPGTRCLEDCRRMHYEIGEFTKMKEENDRAAALFREVTESLSGRAREEAARMTAVLYFLARTAETTVNVKRWSLLRHYVEEMLGIERPALMIKEEWKAIAEDLYGTSDLTPETILALCTKIAEEECENARATIPAVEYDSDLGFEPSMDYIGDKPYIEWKIERTREAVEELREMLSLV